MKQLILFAIVFVTTYPCNAQWKTASANDQVIVFGVHNTSLFASRLAPSGYYVARYASPTDPGVEADGGIAGSKITTFASLGKYFFAGVPGGPAYRSSDNGSNWSGAIAGGPIAANGTYVFSGAGGYGIYRSSDSGANWDSINRFTVNSFGAIGSCIFANANGPLWRSTDNGTDWVQISAPITNIQFFAFIGTITFASNGSGTVIGSTDSGAHWTQISLPRRTVSALAATDSVLFAGTDSGVFISVDAGANWRGVNDGLGNFLHVSALCVFDTFLFVNVTDGNNWYTAFRPISELVKEARSAVQEPMALRDTLSIYPNPATGLVTIFAGGTAIERVSVLNVLGVDVLDVPQPRETEIMLDLSSLPSGTYFVRIETAEGSVLRKIIRE